MTTIQIRIDEKTKRKARKVFSKMGLDVSSGIKLYLARVAEEQAVPFSVREPLKPTKRLQKILAAADKDWAEGKNIHGPFDSVEKFLKALRS